MDNAIATTERTKANAKYIRKELTEGGKVRYIYREAEKRSKKVETVEEIKKGRFMSAIDSVDKGFKRLFEEAVSEIDEQHYACINSGCNSISMTNDIETFFDVLDVPPEYQEKEAFRAASGSFNINKGKIAFCIANFPSDLSESIKKTIMLHDVMHGFFYGAIRLKSKQPLTADSFDKKLDKDYVKTAIAFVDNFGKLDEKMRKYAEDSASEVKGADKEQQLQAQISAAMISPYAALNSEEHFAEAGAYYFSFPNYLKKKEAETYKSFNEFFKKYGD